MPIDFAASSMFRCVSSAAMASSCLRPNLAPCPFICRNLAQSAPARLPSLDKTGLTGNYDFTLEFVSSRGSLNPNMPSGPTIFQAVKEQLV
jgi:uncharacterized protein (TIGR03435 family)